ncbi:hypothetical protein T12_7046 [Trichinella patagoniensis]|uniref:Uncharacterized protein n=1 Tax=Trichinella patagoniensis TaxID=990121 RepID=A0A0V1AEH2_9BILA|nr:hypothetical protein T12_7046 [Trichinella patagoniensis]
MKTVHFQINIIFMNLTYIIKEKNKSICILQQTTCKTDKPTKRFQFYEKQTLICSDYTVSIAFLRLLKLTISYSR